MDNGGGKTIITGHPLPVTVAYPPASHSSLLGGSLGSLPPSQSLASIHLLDHLAAGSNHSPSVSWPTTLQSSVTWSMGSQLSPVIPPMPTTTPQPYPLPSLLGQGARDSLYGQPPAPGVILSPATEPFPQRLVDRVRTGQFVEMRDLLTDNISLLQQLETINHQYQSPSLPGVLRPRLRDVSSLASWVYCFLAYIAIRSTDVGTRHMLAYARLIVREAQRHGGQGWIDYDRVFRQQAAIDPSLQWNTLHPGIQAATLLGRNAGATTLCTLCREPDHVNARCALYNLQEPPRERSPPRAGRAEPLSWPKVRFRTQPYPETKRRICVSWNRGKCVYPGGCNFRHVCATCQQHHKAQDCHTTPAESNYKRGYKGPSYPKTSQS